MDINQKRRLMIIGALTILLGVSVYQHGSKMLFIAGIAISASLIVETLAAKIKKEAYDFTSYFITPLSMTLMLTHEVADHFWMIAVGVIFGVFFAKLLFGGQDRNVFNAEALGMIFILLSFPTYLLNKGTGNGMGDVFVYTTLIVAVFLMINGAMSPYQLITYLVVLVGLYGLGHLANGANATPRQILFGTNMVFIGTFLGTEKSTGAKDKLGQMIQGFLLAFLVWIINTQSSNQEFAAIYAIILINAISPLIDQFTAKYFPNSFKKGGK